MTAQGSASGFAVRAPWALGLLPLLVAGSLGAQVRTVPLYPDDPMGRGRANLEWFGPVTAKYLDFKGQAARREVGRWPRSFLRATPPGRGAAALAVTPLTAAPLAWVNLGPFDDAASGREVASGRLASIVALPNHVLLVATSGGGVFRCANADPDLAGAWVWESVTDSLPASSATGNVAVGCLEASLDGATLFLGLGDAFDATGRGFYRSTDAGATWTESAVAGSALRTYDIRPLGGGPGGVVLLGSNDGLKRSTDGGATFQDVAGPLLTGEIWSIQRLSATEVIASRKDASGTGALYWSADAGATWTQATLAASITGLATGARVLGRMSLRATAASPSEAWGLVQVWDPVTGSPDQVAQGLLHTTDRGHSWTFVAPANPGAAGTLFKGTGAAMVSDGNQGFYNQLLVVSPTDPSRVLVGANLATYLTLNGGLSWTQATEWTGSGHPYAHADAHCHAWAPGGGTLYVGNDGGLAVFKDPWRAAPPTGPDPAYLDNARNRGLATHLVYHLGSTQAPSPAGARYAVTLGCQDVGTLLRQGPSPSALQASGDFHDTVGGDGFGTLLHPLDGNLALASLYRTQVLRSTNGGATFITSTTGITEAQDEDKAPFITRLAPGFGDPTGNTVYTYTNGVVYRSRDFGASWTALGTAGLPPAGTNAATDPANALYIRNLGAARSDPNALGMVANRGRVYLSANGGASWTLGGTLPGNDLSTSFLAFDPASAQTLYVASVAANPDASHLWKSTDGGQSFTALDGSAGTPNGFPRGIPVHVVLPGARGGATLYAGTDFGVYHSADGGSSWARLGSGLPLVAVRDLYVAPDGTYLRAATYGRGLWEMALATGPVVTFTAGGAAQVAPGGTAAYAATVTGSAANSKVVWSDGGEGGQFAPAVTASGAATTYTAAATPRLATLTAASQEDPAAAASFALQVYDPAALTVTVTPATHVMLGGEVFSAFQATVAGAPTPGVSWLASAGAITAAGVFTAPALALGSQAITLTATSPYTGPGRAGTAQVTVKSLDLTGDGAVGLDDLAFLAYAFGTPNPAAKLSDGATVGDADLAAFLARF